MESILTFLAGHSYLTAILVGLILALILNECYIAFQAAKQITPFEMVKLFNGPGVYVIDVRPPQEFSKGHITNAVNVFQESLSEKKTFRAFKDMTKPLIVVGETGHVSHIFIKTFKDLGFEKVYVLEGGLHAWSDAGYPVIKL